MDGTISHLSQRRLAAALLILWLPVVLWLTLRGDPVASRAAARTAWWCVSCGPAGSADLFQNLLLILPIGLGLSLSGWRLGPVAATVLALSLGIELLQGALDNGRDATLGDVLANGAGGVLGWVLGRLRGWLGAHSWRAAAPIGAGLFVAQLIATASLVGPSPAGPDPWHLRLRPETAGIAAYRGDITSIALGGRSILIESPRPRQARVQDAADLAAGITWDPASDARLTPILRIDDARAWAVAAVDRRGDSIGISLRTVAGEIRFRTPTWLIGVPAQAAAGDTLRITLSFEPGRTTVTLTHGSMRVEQRLRYGAQHGWTLINPFSGAHGASRPWNLWTLGWLLGWGMVVGLTGMPARRPAIWLGAALAGLLVISAAAGAIASPAEAAAFGFGWLAVTLTGRRFLPPPAGA